MTDALNLAIAGAAPVGTFITGLLIGRSQLRKKQPGIGLHRHRWSPWEQLRVVTVFQNEGDQIPVDKVAVMGRACVICGYAESRKVHGL